MNLPAPMPDTHSPVYADVADFVRRALAEGRARFAVNLVDDADMITLKIRRCAAPAPYVAPHPLVEAVYVWHVAVDRDGRYIAGPAALVWRP